MHSARIDEPPMPFTEPLRIARKTLCSILAASKIDGTVGSCLYAAIILRMTVKLYCDRNCAVIRGGDGEGDGGYIDDAGVTHGHYWVEAIADDGERFVLDVTADQFGGPAVVEIPSAKAMNTYRPGRQATVDQHVAEELEWVESAR